MGCSVCPAVASKGNDVIGSEPKPSLRTLQLGNDWPSERVGGLNRYFADLLKSLPSTGVDVRGLVVGPPDITRETDGVVSAFSSSKAPILLRLWRARQAVLKSMERGEADLLVSHFALYAAALGAKAARQPMVVHFHGPWAAESTVEGAASLALRAKFSLERSVYRRGRLFIVLSRAFQQELTRRFGISEDRIRIVPGGIDTVRFNTTLTRAEARLRLGWPTDRPILLAVRRLVRRMGLENLIDAANQLRERHPDLLLLLGGKGPISGELQERINSHGLQHHVHLLGRISEEDLPVAYRAADMTLVPSQALEGFGMITLESLASGTPVLVTPVGGLPEVVQPFAPECVFADTSTEAISSLLAAALGGHLTLPSESLCRGYAESHFAWPLIAKRVGDVYAEALQ